MKAILVDDYGYTKEVVLGPGDEIRVIDEFVPCGYCGNAVLIANFAEDMCRDCHNAYDGDHIITIDPNGEVK